jgi:acetyl-CoA carboxylase carboxyltransferase component
MTTNHSSGSSELPDGGPVLLAKARQGLQQAHAAAQARAASQSGRLAVRDGIALLVDSGSLLEYGSLATPSVAGMHGAGDGLVAGMARVRGHRVALAAYDANVYAGTQSVVNNMKLERILEIAQRERMPFIGWFNGGGMRPQDLMGEGTRVRKPNMAFVEMARLSGFAPTIALVSGPSFAGNAALAGLCDVIIATRSASMGMAGPALVESALGQKLKPEEIGPVAALARAGVVDVLCDDERQAVEVAARYLAFFTDQVLEPRPPASDKIANAVPASPKRAYDMRKVIDGLVDAGSWLELRTEFGRGMLTGLARIDGRRVGIVANQPMVLAGVIDGDAADKAARLVELCDVFGIPVVFLCDTPGFMCGPQAEVAGLIRRGGRLVSVLANASTPFFTVQLRKAYGLGAFMMGSAWVKARLVMAWPDAEYGGMGIEGAVSLMHRRKLEAIESEEDRQVLHKMLADDIRQANTSMATAARFAIDEVIPPESTREVLANALRIFTGEPATVTARRPVRPW